MLWVILTVIFVILLYYTCIKPFSYWKKLDIPYLTPLPIFGNIAPNVFRMTSLMDNFKDLYNAASGKRYIGLYSFFEPILLIRDPELVKQITIKEFDTFPDHRPMVASESVDPIAGRSLFSLNRANGWQDMRATLSPAFTGSKMKMIYLLIEKCAQQLVDHCAKQGEYVETNLKEILGEVTNDVIATTAFGIECNTLENNKNQFYIRGQKLTDFSGIKSLFVFIANSFIAKLFKLSFFDIESYEFFLDIVTRTIKSRKEKNIFRPDILQLLMTAREERENSANEIDNIDSGFASVQEYNLGKTNKKIKANLEVADITAQAAIFFLAGFEGVSTSMCLTLYELALNPDIQERLYQEICETLNSNDSVTYESLLKMKYLDCVISESLRLRSFSSVLDRKSIKPFTIKPELEGEKPVHLPTGTLIWIFTDAIHNDLQYFPDPAKFDPDRFSNENKHKVNPYTFLPFGIGPRNCIGSRYALLAMKSILFKFIQHFKVVPSSKTPIPFAYPKDTMNALPHSGLWLGVKRRVKV